MTPAAGNGIGGDKEERPMNTNTKEQGSNQNAGNSAPITAEQAALAQLWSAVGENAQLQAQVATATANRLIQVENGSRDAAAALATAVLELQQLVRDMDSRMRNLESRMEKSLGAQASMTPMIHTLSGVSAAR
jgi:hypothetical protein